jgi:hypothetical protein
MVIYLNDIELDISILNNYVHINNSFKVTSRDDMNFVLDKIKTNYPNHEICNISNFMLVQEWATHNLLYSLGLFKDKTRDVDLNINKSWFISSLYCIIGFLYI